MAFEILIFVVAILIRDLFITNALFKSELVVINRVCISRLFTINAVVISEFSEDTRPDMREDLADMRCLPNVNYFRQESPRIRE